MTYTLIPTTVVSPPPSNATSRVTLRRWDWALGLAGVAVGLILWEVLSQTGALPADVLPSAGTVLARLGELAGTAAFWANVWATLQSSLIGLLLVATIAAGLALAIGLSRIIRESTWFPIEFLKPIPPIVVIPLGLLLWGPSLTMKVTLITFGAVWPLLTQLLYGIRETDRTLLDMTRSYKLGGWLTATRVVVPTLLPYALTGLRISASIAVVVSVVTELVGGARGLGQAIAVAQVNSVLPTLYAYVLSAGLLGILINLIFMAAERPLLFWHPSIREKENAR